MENDAIVLDLIFDEINFTLSEAQLGELIEEEVDHLQLMIKVHDGQGKVKLISSNIKSSTMASFSI
jgi:hypothetical protein